VHNTQAMQDSGQAIRGGTHARVTTQQPAQMLSSWWSVSSVSSTGVACPSVVAAKPPSGLFAAPPFISCCEGDASVHSRAGARLEPSGAPTSPTPSPSASPPSTSAASDTPTSGASTPAWRSDKVEFVGSRKVAYGTDLGMRTARAVRSATISQTGKRRRCRVMCGSRNGSPSWERRKMQGLEPSLTSCRSRSCGSGIHF
jgi:hypothetical protein